MRCFVALDLPDALIERLARIVRALAEAAPRADVRWVEPEKLHVTLQFLGEVRDGEVDALVDALRAEAAAHVPFSVAVAGLGAFPGLRRARVLWAGIATGLAPLARVAGGVAHRLAPLGFAPEARPFRGHVTLARVRSPRGLGALVDAVARMPADALGAWTAREIVLYRSRLRPTGSEYTAVARLPLGGPPVAEIK